MFVFVMLLWVLLTVRWLRWVVAAAAAVATLLKSFEWILSEEVQVRSSFSSVSVAQVVRVDSKEF